MHLTPYIGYSLNSKILSLIFILPRGTKRCNTEFTSPSAQPHIRFNRQIVTIVRLITHLRQSDLSGFDLTSFMQKLNSLPKHHNPLFNLLCRSEKILVPLILNNTVVFIHGKQQDVSGLIRNSTPACPAAELR